MKQSRPLLIWALCLVCGLAVGISGYSSDSNHPTYLPPSLHYLDPQFLTHDWWLNAARHYHFAFFALSVVLAKLNILESGLACLNVLTVSLAVYACFKIIEWFRSETPVAALAIFVAILLASGSFFSIGASYLFSPSLQPSSIAAAATLAALSSFLRRQYGHCGLWLFLAGLFHINYLIANILFFATAYVFSLENPWPLRRVLSKPVLLDFLKLLGPCILLVTAFAPLILSVQSEAITPALSAKADWIFFRFAVPFHYYPLGYIPYLIPFALWQFLGLLWTRRALPDPSQRRQAWAIQGALALILWLATALTTFVFVAPVSRLFLWRLAPFAVLFSALVIIVGALRMFQTDKATRLADQGVPILLAVSLATSAFLSMLTGYLLGQLVSLNGFSPAPVLLCGLFIVLILHRWLGFNLPGHPLLSGAILTGLIVGGIATQPGDGQRSRYSLLHQSAELRSENQLYEYVRQSTPQSAQFLVPPDLDYFRLEAQRAIVVDLKALPMNRAGIVEWYHRLEDVSGVTQPDVMQAVKVGFAELDSSRAEALRCKYRLDFIVMKSTHGIPMPDWTEVFHNDAFKLLKYQGAKACTQRIPTAPS